MEISCIKKSPAPFPAKISKFKGQSVRALPLRILTVGKKRSPGIQFIVEEYNEKIRHYCNLEDIHIKSNPRNTSNVKAQIEAEDMIMMQHIRPEDWVVVLDEHGADICSEQMADLVGDAGRTGSVRLAFCIGGPYGHGPQLRERADVTIRLSALVLNHQIALILLLEQLYRAKVPSLETVYQSINNPLYSKSQDLHTVIIAHLQLSLQVVSKYPPNHKAFIDYKRDFKLRFFWTKPYWCSSNSNSISSQSIESVVILIKHRVLYLQNETHYKKQKFPS